MPRLAGIAERRHEPFYAMVRVTERQRELVQQLRGFESTCDSVDTAWVRPMDLGATDRSHHARTLRQLVKKGLAERRLRGSLLNQIRGSDLYEALAQRKRSRHAPRGSYVYRLTDPGRRSRLVVGRK